MPGSLIIVGLGPGDPDLRTVGTQRALDGAGRIILRTAIHPGVKDLTADSRTSTCDDLYDRLESFDDVYKAIADRVLNAAQESDVVFAVPGHPFFGERSVALTLALAAAKGVSASVLSGVSALDVMCTALGSDPLAEQAQIVDAASLDTWLRQEPFGGSLLSLDPSRPMLVTQVYSTEMASSTKLALGRLYPEEHSIQVITAGGVPGEESVVACRLHELDHVPVNHLTSVWVPALTALEASRSAATLHRITSMLRAPDGCPWDRKQTHGSLRDSVIEEAHEVVDAIDEDDSDHLAEELGDLLLQVALHAQIAEEAGEFTIEDVYDHVNRKLVRRHPHVFGDANVATAEEVITTWQGVKAQERKSKGEPDIERSPFDKLPRSMPVMTRVADLLRSEMTDVSASPTDNLGDNLLNAVAALVATGLDPERELEQAFRRRSAVAL